MRDKVLRLAEHPLCRAIKVERKEGRRYMAVNEFSPEGAPAAWSCALDDAGGEGGLYRFAAIDSDGNVVASHRYEMPKDEAIVSDSVAFRAFLVQQNRQLLGLLGDVTTAIVENAKQAPIVLGGNNGAADEKIQLIGTTLGTFLSEAFPEVKNMVKITSAENKEREAEAQQKAEEQKQLEPPDSATGTVGGKKGD